ncbi:MAG: class I SAM-dependent methyltransferase [Chthonomonas sp.]|nr:class I SAM-dependent methyltransferase [Chthonomonas sp.]
MSAVLERQESFSTVTELPGKGASPDALLMLATRYAVAGELAPGGDVLEVACGGGMGLGHLLRVSNTVTAGDFDPAMVEVVNKYYEKRLVAQRLDAMNLDFADASFDCVLLLEAIYFVPDAARAVSEAFRVLRPGGKFMIAAPNPLFVSFNAAPYSTKYFSPLEFKKLLEDHGFSAETLCGFPEEGGGLKTKVLNVVRKLAVTFRLIPDTMEGKERIKKLIYGELPPFPNEVVVDPAKVETPVPTDSVGDISKYRVLYAIGTKPLA